MTPYPDTAALTFVRKHHEYDSVYSYVFTSARPVIFTAGAYAHVRLLSLPLDIRRVREFSFASSPQDPHIQFGIDTSSGSDYQIALQSLTEGDTVEIFKIKSHLTWPHTKAHTVMIAGGIGVTPFRGMVRDATQKALGGGLTLLHVGRDNFLYGEELRELVADYRTTDRECLQHDLDIIVGEHIDAQYFVAGSIPFVDSVAEILQGKGVQYIETDAFKGLVEG
jgi:ferredoxin-NADP reductase